MEATILLLGWQPVIQAFDQRLLHYGKNTRLRVTQISTRCYCTVDNIRALSFMDARPEAVDMLDWSDAQIECFYARIMEIENESQN